MRYLSLLLFITFSSSSYAIEATFYTEGNFQIIVDALKRVSLFYGSPLTLVASFFVLGVLIAAITGATAITTQKLSGQGSGNPFLASLAVAVIGLVVFTAGVVPKSAVTVYDKKLNKVERVSGVPTIIAFPLWGISSAIETFAQTENTSSAYTYGSLSNTTPFELVKEAYNSAGMYDPHFISSIDAYFRDCAPSAIASGRLSMDRLQRGTDRLLGELSNAVHNAIETTTFTAANPNGIANSCNQAWSHIRATSDGPSGANHDKQLSRICRFQGLNSNMAQDRSTCTQNLSDAMSTIYGNGVTSIPWNAGLNNLLVAQVLGNILSSGGGTTAINIELSRQTTAESMGAWEASNRYIPIIKGVLFSILIGVAPVLLSFIVTPLMGKAAKLYFGMWAFYGLWLVIDMTILTSMNDTLHAATAELAVNQMGLLSIWATPSVMTDTLSLVGGARSIGLTAAVLMAATLFGISAHGLAGFAQKLESDVEQKGKSEGADNMLSENAGAKMEGIVNGNASINSIAGGAVAATRSRAMNSIAETASGNIVADNFGGVNGGASAIARMESANRVGSATAASNESFDDLTQSARVSQEAIYSQGDAISGMARLDGSSTRDYQQDKSTLGEGKEFGTLQQMKQGSGLTTNGINAGIADGADTRARSDTVLMGGENDIYRSSSQSLEQRIEHSKAVDNQNGDSRTYFADTANRDVAENRGNNVGYLAVGQEQTVAAQAGSFVEDKESSLTATESAGGTLSDRANLATQSTERSVDEAIGRNVGHQAVGSDGTRKAEAGSYVDDKQTSIATTLSAGGAISDRAALATDSAVRSTDEAIGRNIGHQAIGSEGTREAEAGQYADERQTSISTTGAAGGSLSSRIELAGDSAERITSESLGNNEGFRVIGADGVRSAEAGRYSEEQQQSLTKTDVAGGAIEDRIALAEKDATISTHDEIASHNMRDAIKTTFGMTDSEAAAALVSEQRLTLTADESQAGYQSGAISQTQNELAQNNDGMTLSLSGRGDADTGVDVISSDASKSQSTSLDNSQRYNKSFTEDNSIRRDNSVEHDASVLSLNDNSNRVLFSDADQLQSYISDIKPRMDSQAGVAREVGIGSATGLKSIVSFDNSETYTGQNSVSASAAVTASTGKLNPFISASATLATDNVASDISSESRTEDQAVRHFGGVYSDIDNFNSGKVGGEFKSQVEADRATAEMYSDYYRHVANSASSGEMQKMEEFDKFIRNGSLDDVWSQYQKDSGVSLEQPQQLKSTESSFGQYGTSDQWKLDEAFNDLTKSGGVSVSASDNGADNQNNNTLNGQHPDGAAGSVLFSNATGTGATGEQSTTADNQSTETVTSSVPSSVAGSSTTTAEGVSNTEQLSATDTTNAGIQSSQPNPYLAEQQPRRSFFAASDEPAQNSGGVDPLTSNNSNLPPAQTSDMSNNLPPSPKGNS